MITPKFKVKTTKLTSPPFKNMKNIDVHGGIVNDCTSVLFPNGKTKIVTCSNDCTLQIFDLETEKCEELVKHGYFLLSVRFYEEEQVLMTTDFKGELILWNIFSSPSKVIKKVKITETYTFVKELTQISCRVFFCCVSAYSSCTGSLYSIDFDNFKKNDNIKVEEIQYPIINNNRNGLECIYKLKSEKNTILFSGDIRTIKKYNFNTKKHFTFQEEQDEPILCLTSYINEKNEEIVLSGGRDKKIVFWNLEKGQSFKEIKLESWIHCFLNDFERNNIFFVNGFDDYSIYSLNLKTEKIIKSVQMIHIYYITCVCWIDEKKSKFEKFITCSSDRSFSIFELEKLPNKYENKDLDERISFIRDEEFIQNYFSSKSNKKMIFCFKFWNGVRINNIFKVFLACK